MRNILRQFYILSVFIIIASSYKIHVLAWPDCQSSEIGKCGPDAAPSCRLGYKCNIALFCISWDSCAPNKGKVCSPTGCSATNGCGWGYRCVDTGTASSECHVDDTCVPPTGTTCTGDKCGPGNGCGYGERCYSGHCGTDPNGNCSGTPPGANCNDPNGTCGALPDTGGGTCPAGQSCQDKICTVNASCPKVGSTGTACTALGCGHGCDADHICVLDQVGSGTTPTTYRCDPDNDHICHSNVCSGEGCGNGCAPGYKCTYQPEPPHGYRCEANNQCNPNACQGNACSSTGCGYGYSCKDGQCIVDPTCTPTQVQAPYTGPKITSFAGLVSRGYNLLFPAAILYGVIMIIRAGYILMTSEGNPQKTRTGQEDLTSAILGTIFVVLSAAILRIIIIEVLGGSVGF